MDYDGLQMRMGVQEPKIYRTMPYNLQGYVLISIKS